MITIEVIAKNPVLVSTIPREQLMQLYAMAVTAQGLILPALLAPAVKVDIPEALLSLEVVAERLGVKKSRVAAAARRGDFPTVMVGRYPRVRPEALAQLIDRGGLPMVTSRRDQGRIPAAPRATRLQPSATRRRNGHHQGVDLAVGVRRSADLGVGGQVPDAPGPDPE
jgi:hypothetical protein